MLDDTIAAISTPIGIAGISIVRISGPKATDIIFKIFNSKDGKKKESIKPYNLYYGYIIEPATGKKIDEVLISYMKRPHSFTAEDVIEINCHGGIISTKTVLETVLKAGARPAEPGEFSKRAFLNGRIDLAQAEAIIDAINAKTEKGLNVAIGQLEGKLSKKITELNNIILQLLAFIEAGIDFPEDDIEELSIKEIHLRTKIIENRIEEILQTAETGKIYREGIRTVILGKPNVGKSSLLNALLKENRAIVTDIPGTTRDLIEEFVNISGIPLKIVDTAGIRETEDEVEKIGVERAKETSKNADLILFVIDATQGISKEDISVLNLLEGKKAIVIINKIDLKSINISNLKQEIITDHPVIELSAKQEIGIDNLEHKIIDLFMSGKVKVSDETIISNVRHKNALERAKNHIKEVLTTINKGMPTDCIAIDLKSAWECLGEISGETLDEDIIDKIFRDFCIGK